MAFHIDPAKHLDKPLAYQQKLVAIHAIVDGIHMLACEYLDCEHEADQLHKDLEPSRKQLARLLTD